MKSILARTVSFVLLASSLVFTAAGFADDDVANAGHDYELLDAVPDEVARLSKEHLQYVDDLLNSWEAASRDFETFSYEFRRWDYDEAFLSERNPITKNLFAKSVATGRIEFVSKDKWRYEVNDKWRFVRPPSASGEEPEYAKQDSRENWVRDGESVYEFNYEKKILREHKVPIDPREQADEELPDGSLPDRILSNSLRSLARFIYIERGHFHVLFQQNADELKERYWIRVVTPHDSQSEYWLELWPKRVVDSQCFKKLVVTIAEEDLLPKSLTVFEVNHDPTRGMTRKVTFEFFNRQQGLSLTIEPEQEAKNLPAEWHRMSKLEK